MSLRPQLPIPPVPEDTARVARAACRVGTPCLVPRDQLGTVHQAAHILGNHQEEDAAKVRRRWDGLLAAMARHHARAGRLAQAVDHFRKVARSYRPGLFHCYTVADVPRTNNALEQLFASQRYHERRATGRRGASPAAVLRGEVRLIAATATRLHPPTSRTLG